jgi:hypothetical protein
LLLNRNINQLELKTEYLTNDSKLPFDASETKQFALFQSLMIHHKINDKQVLAWQILITLVEIIEMSIAPGNTQKSIKHFQELIENHLELFKENIVNLRPKQVS